MVNVFRGIEPNQLMAFIEDRFHLEKDEQFRRALGEFLTECRKIVKRWDEAATYEEKKPIIPKINEVIERLIDSRKLSHDEIDYVKTLAGPLLDDPEGRPGAAP